MNFTTAVSTGLAKLFVFKGRASRSEFWWMQLFTFLISIPISILLGLFSVNVFIGMYLVNALFMVSVFGRRVNDYAVFAHSPTKEQEKFEKSIFSQGYAVSLFIFLAGLGALHGFFSPNPNPDFMDKIFHMLSLPMLALIVIGYFWISYKESNPFPNRHGEPPANILQNSSYASSKEFEETQYARAERYKAQHARITFHFYKFGGQYLALAVLIFSYVWGGLFTLFKIGVPVAVGVFIASLVIKWEGTLDKKMELMNKQIETIDKENRQKGKNESKE